MSAAGQKQSGRSGRKPPQYITFTQQLKPEYWPGWDPAWILSGDVTVIGEEALCRYEEAGGDCQGLWIIKHDRDVLADGTLKDDHVHVVLQQSQGRQVEGKLQVEAIDAALGFAKSIVRAPKRGGRIENALAYLIHAKDPDKCQYAIDEVVTLRGQDYVEIEAEHHDAWARRAVMGRQAAVPMKEWAELGDVLVQRALDGEVDEVDILRDKALVDIYTRNQVRVDLALKNRARREMMFEVEKLRAGIFQKTIIWAMGASEQGKTYLGESIVSELSAQLGWSVFRATAQNGPDDYEGQEIFFMNEPSSKVMAWADLLQLLDPRQAGPISARYHNKKDAAPRAIIIAVVTDPVQFGFFVPGKRSTGDSLDQLLRRITLVVEAEKIDSVPHYAFSRMAATETYKRRIQLPGDDGRGNVKFETVFLKYRPEEIVGGLAHGAALEAVMSTIATRSPDSGLPSLAQSRLNESLQALEARGVFVSNPPVAVRGAGLDQIVAGDLVAGEAMDPDEAIT